LRNYHSELLESLSLNQDIMQQLMQFTLDLLKAVSRMFKLLVRKQHPDLKAKLEFQRKKKEVNHSKLTKASTDYLIQRNYLTNPNHSFLSQ